MEAPWFAQSVLPTPEFELWGDDAETHDQLEVAVSVQGPWGQA